MNYALKLLIPAALGIAAATLNWMVLSAGTKPVYYVTVKQPLDVGDSVDLDLVRPLPVPQDFANLSTTMVPFQDRGVLSGRVVRRKIEIGDPIFFADTDLRGEWLDLQPNEELFPVPLDNVSVEPRLLRIGNMIHFRVPPLPSSSEAGPVWVGPFRIVTVGSKINNNFSEGRGYGGSGTLTVGIAYNVEETAQQKRLQDFCDQQKGGGGPLLGIRIADKS